MENFNQELKPTSIVFRVQSPEDFYRHLHEFNDTHYPELTIEDTELAGEMLENIGVKIK